MERNQVEQRLKWNTDDIFPSDEAWEKAYAEAEKGRKNGSLSDADLDNFYNALAPMLDGAKRKKLEQVVKKLKKT